jgi:hypothetical protein
MNADNTNKKEAGLGFYLRSSAIIEAPVLCSFSESLNGMDMKLPVFTKQNTPPRPCGTYGNI